MFKRIVKLEKIKIIVKKYNIKMQKHETLYHIILHIDK